MKNWHKFSCSIALALTLAGPLAAQLGTIRLAPRNYDEPAVITLPRGASLRILTPAGDTLYLASLADSVTAVGCVLGSRLRVMVNSDTLSITDFHAREPGRAALTPHFSTLTPSGEAFVIEEIFRRKITCDPGDGFLAVWSVLRAPGRRS